MLIVISPAKTLDFESKIPDVEQTLPEFLSKSKQLISALKKLKPGQLSNLMHMSAKLGQLNYERYQEWNLDKSTENARQAIFAFKGDVYIGLDIDQFTSDDFSYAQDHLRILSGLHGSLRPLDLIQPYRLEMGTGLSVRNKSNLYEFWTDLITKALKQHMKSLNTDTLVNLASQEYFKSINAKKLNARIVTPEFKEFKNDSYKFFSFYGKKARGMMARFIIQNRITAADDLKLFEEDGYFYNEKLSKEGRFVFTRD